jgi:RIO-like serine/threonine protein kinase
MKAYMDDDFSQFLKNKNIDGFDGLWNLQMERVEEGNYRHAASQSEVSRWHHVYVKKQQNYTTSFSRWFMARAVCAREFHNISAWHKIGIPTLEPLYFFQEPMARRAILVTKALDGYQSLESWLAATADPSARSRVLTRVAELIADIHSKGWYHRCFFPKHVFVNQSNPEIIKFIDLEKARKQFRTTYRDMADIASFFRRCQWLNPKEGLAFMKAYWGVNKFETKHRLLLKRLQDRVAAKS